jgi:hypothetical protein
MKINYPTLVLQHRRGFGGEISRIPLSIKRSSYIVVAGSGNRREDIDLVVPAQQSQKSKNQRLLVVDRLVVGDHDLRVGVMADAVDQEGVVRTTPCNE